MRDCSCVVSFSSWQCKSAPGLIRSISRSNLVTCGNRVAVPCIYLCTCTYANGGKAPQSEYNTSNFNDTLYILHVISINLISVQYFVSILSISALLVI